MVNLNFTLYKDPSAYILACLHSVIMSCSF